MSDLTPDNNSKFGENVFSTTAEAIEQGLLDKEHFELVYSTLRGYWQSITSLIPDSHFVEPSYVFISNEDLGKLMSMHGEKMEYCYFNPDTSTIFINLSYPFSLENPNKNNLSLFGQLIYSVITHYSPEEGGTLDTMKVSVPEGDTLSKVYRDQGEAKFMQLDENYKLPEAIYDVAAIYPYDLHKLREKVDLLVGILLAVDGTNILGFDVKTVGLLGINRNKKKEDDLVVDLLAQEKEVLQVWAGLIYKHLKYGKVYKDEFEKYYKDNPLFKSILKYFLDRSGLEKRTFSQLVYWKEKEELNRKDIKDLNSLWQSMPSVLDIELTVNNINLRSENPINEMLRELLIKNGLLKPMVVFPLKSDLLSKLPNIKDLLEP